MSDILDAILEMFDRLSDGFKLLLLVLMIAALVLMSIWKLRNFRQNRLLRKELKSVKRERDQLQHRLDSLDKVDEHVWSRPDAFQSNRFIEKQTRDTRIISILNLKGGVGKTTMTTNLGACLALLGKRVLLIDFDFQATLSRFLLVEDLLKTYQRNNWTSQLLIDSEAALDTIEKYAFDMKGVANAKGMISHGQLEIAEFSQQAKFFVNPEHEVRFLTQRLLHRPDFFAQFDFVLFDCPPRMTTACINALTCSDYVLIPTSLSQLDIESVPRTLYWLKQLHQIIRADLLGVVISRYQMRAGGVVSADVPQLTALPRIMRDYISGEGHVFKSKIPEKPEIHRSQRTGRPIVLDSQAARGWYEEVCREMEGRIQS